MTNVLSDELHHYLSTHNWRIEKGHTAIQPYFSAATLQPILKRYHPRLGHHPNVHPNICGETVWWPWSCDSYLVSSAAQWLNTGLSGVSRRGHSYTYLLQTASLITSTANYFNDRWTDTPAISFWICNGLPLSGLFFFQC